VNVDVSAAGASAAIGQNGFGSPPSSEFQQYHGDLSELIAVGGTLGDDDLAKLEAYLMTKYGIP
jgi:hypothetical protein